MNLHEVYFRLYAPEDNQPPYYHVLLADRAKDAFGDIKETMYGPYTPAQAEGKGYGLSKIIEEINTALMVESDGLRQQVQDLTAQTADLQAKLAASDSVAADLQAKLDDQKTAAGSETDSVKT